MNNITDTQRLDFLLRHQAFITWSKDREVCRVAVFDYGQSPTPYLGFRSVFLSEREAIDACIKCEDSHA